MYVLVDMEFPGGYFRYLDRDGICHSDSIDGALPFESREELNAFLEYLSFYLGMDYAYYYKVVEI